MSSNQCPSCNKSVGLYLRCVSRGHEYCDGCVKTHRNTGCSYGIEFTVGIDSVGDRYDYCGGARRHIPFSENYFWKGHHDHDLD